MQRMREGLLPVVALGMACLLTMTARVDAQPAAGPATNPAPPSGAANAPGFPPAFAPCSVCHSIDGSNGVGPSLKGVVGRKAGTLPGFRYSRGMRAVNLTWDTTTLDRYLTDPQSLVPGNVMPFAGVIDAKARAALIAYLSTLK